MSPLRKIRVGTELKANRRSVPFSFWPVAANNSQRPPVQSLLFAADPWLIMKRSINDQIAIQETREEASSYIEQASDFYNSALQSHIDAAKPVQLYYSYLNIAKAFVLCRGLQRSLSPIYHGINEAVPNNGTEFDQAYVQFKRPTGRLQVFDEFIQALGYSQLPNGTQIPIVQLLPQILPGHRLWASAAGKQERFLSLQRVQFTEHKTSRQVWLRLYLYKDDLTRLGQPQIHVLQQSRISNVFRRVQCDETIGDRQLICFEERTATVYRRHGVDEAMKLVNDVRSGLWAIVASSSPYRRYYLYLSPPNTDRFVLPQLASIYALTFYLGSVTRYRPTVFRSILEGDYGPCIAEFVSGHPAQFVYLMASEFAKQDVTQPAII